MLLSKLNKDTQKFILYRNTELLIKINVPNICEKMIEPPLT